MFVKRTDSHCHPPITPFETPPPTHPPLSCRHPPSPQLLADANLFSVSKVLSSQGCHLNGITQYGTFGDWLLLTWHESLRIHPVVMRTVKRCSVVWTDPSVLAFTR